jgi:hypothetical protein
MLKRLFLQLCVVSLCVYAPGIKAQRSVHVDTQIGTHGSGQVHLGVSVPFGLTNAAVFRTPTNINHTLGVSLLNIQGTGCQSGALGHVIVRGSDLADTVRDPSQALWYGVNASTSSLLDISYGNLRHVATATMRGVIHQIVPNSPTRGRYVVIDVGLGYTPARNVKLIGITDSTADVSLEVGGFCTHPVYRRIYAHIKVQGAILSPHADSIGLILSGRRISSAVTITIGLSLTSTENAIRNHDAEFTGRAFDEIVADAQAAWDQEFDRFAVSGGTRADRVMFYTALYRIMQHPSNAEDVTGDHVRFNSNTIDHDSTYIRTIGHDLWGIYQTNMPFYAMFLPDQWKNVIKTLVEMSIEAGETPQFDFLGKQVYIMGGDPFPMVVIDSYFNGSLSNSDVHRLLPILERASTTSGTIRPFTYLVDEYGYIPVDRSNGPRRHNNVANLLEYTTADAANAIVAREIGDMKRSLMFSARAARIWNVFDGRSGWFRERTMSGDTVSGLDVDAYDGDYTPGTGGPGFKEGSAREFLFFPQHVRREIARRLGGWDAFAQRLDVIFEGGPRPYSVHNQVQMHLPFQYLYVPDSAHRAHRYAREALRAGFDIDLDGLPGNDDLGSTSAWAVLVMMGLYPSTGFEGTWLVVAPVFDTVVAGHLTIIRQGEPGPYVRSVRVDGTLVAQTHIDDAVLRSAHEVVIETATEPQPQLRRWNRQEATLTWSGSSAVIHVDDTQRQTPIEVMIGEYGSNVPIRIDTLEASAAELSVPNAPDRFWWALRDLGDPSGRLAWIRYNGSRTQEVFTVPLVRPNPVYNDLYVADNNGLYPIQLVVTDLTGRVMDLDIDSTPLVSTDHLTTGTYHLKAIYPDGVVRTSTFMIVK